MSKAKYNQFKAALEIASENAGDYDLNNLPSDLHDVVDNLPDHMWDSLESYSNDVYTARKRGFESASEFINQVLNNTRRRPVLAFCTRHLTALLVGIVVLIRSLLTLSHEQLLTDAEALVDGQVTFAALVLFGTRQSLGKYLAQSETVFEYRSSDTSGPAQHREEFRQGFFGYYDKLWDLINRRNDIQNFQSGLFILDVPTFSERTVREAVLNAVSHRDYQLGGSVFVRQYPRYLRIESPGGFPLGINESNVLDRQEPRNRRIADIFAKCGLVERSGQGMNLMFETNIKEGKLRPDFSGTDQYQVNLTLDGEVRDTRFLEFLEKIDREKQALFSTSDFLLLDVIHRGKPVPEKLQPRLHSLVDIGAIERFGRGRGVRYILSRKYYAMTGQRGHYTRRKGLDRDANKALLLKHIQENANGSPLKELSQVLPTLTRPQVQTLLRELRNQGEIHHKGTTRAALWFPGPTYSSIASDKEEGSKS